MDEWDLSNCAYYRGVGTCSYSCYSEPACFTDEPLEGWPGRLTKKLTPAKLAIAEGTALSPSEED